MEPIIISFSFLFRYLFTSLATQLSDELNNYIYNQCKGTKVKTNINININHCNKLNDDEKEKIMVTEELIFAGVQFNNESDYKGDFENTDIKLFMDKYLSKELFQNSNTINIGDNTDTISNKIIKELYSKGYTKEQITTIALDILNQMLKNTPPDKIDVKQKLKTPNK